MIFRILWMWMDFIFFAGCDSVLFMMTKKARVRNLISKMCLLVLLSNVENVTNFS